MTTTQAPPEFEPLDCDQADNTPAANYQQADLCDAIADDLKQQGKYGLAVVFKTYAVYSRYVGHDWRWRELGEPLKGQACRSHADDLYESLPDWAKWA